MAKHISNCDIFLPHLSKLRPVLGYPVIRDGKNIFIMDISLGQKTILLVSL